MRVAVNGKAFGHAVKGGAARVGINMLRSMADQRPDWSFDIYIPCVETSHLPARLPANVRLLTSRSRLYRSGALRSAWEQLLLPGLVRRGGYDVLVNPTNSAPVLLGTGSRQLLLVHDTGFLNREWYSPFYSRYVVWLMRRAARRGVEFVTSTRISAGEIGTLLPGVDGVTVIPFDGDEPPETSPPAEVEDPFVLYLGSMNPRKNPEGAVAGFRVFMQGHNESTRLVIAGGSKAIFRQADLDHVDGDRSVVLGYVSDEARWALLRDARLLLFPSYLEGFGLPIIEAFRVGTPVVASDTPIIRELYGDAVEYVDPHSAQDIARGIARVYSNEAVRGKLIAAGRERASHFSWRKSGASCIELIEQGGTA